jgi:hypothetical protein
MKVQNQNQRKMSYAVHHRYIVCAVVVVFGGVFAARSPEK